MRKQFLLPEEDLEFLGSQPLPWETVEDGGVKRVVIHDYPIPQGYSEIKVDFYFRLEPGYPDTQIDMVYFYPGLTRLDGIGINSIATEPFDGKSWQRWSRHRTPQNPWRVGIDNIGTQIGLVQEWLEKELRKKTA